jgi:putative ABC transport system permease protein
LVVRESTVPVGFEVTPAMAVVAVAVGIGVTMLGGLVPAIRAGRVTPLAALSDTRGGAERRARVAIPLLLLTVGAGVAAVAASRPGGFAGVKGVIAGSGIVLAFVGIAGLSRWIVRPLLTLVGAPVGAITGRAARLGIGNARRQPSRTAGAASTLMVGLALVGFVATIGASVRSTVESQFTTAGSADLYLERRGVVRVSTQALEVDLAGKLRRPFRSASITALDGAVVGAGGATTTASASFLPELAELVDLGVTEGAVPRVATDASTGHAAVILSESAAADLGLAVGDGATLRTISGSEQRLEVAAVYSNTAVAGDAVIDVTALDPSVLGTFELGVLRFEGRHGERSMRAVERAAGHFPKVRVHTPSEFGRLNASVTDTVLRIIGVVLVGMIGIGYLGLVATLGLSTLERRRELVMLRAIGAARAQVRAMVWVEATLIALIAAVVGLGVGVTLGWVGGSVAPSDLVARVIIPWPMIVAVGVASLGVAWGVSLGVARRASLVPPAEAGRGT